MDSALEPQVTRRAVALALARHLPAGRAPSTARELTAVARQIGAGLQTDQFHFRPPYPGVTAGPEAVPGGIRLVLACRAFDRDGSPIGVVFTTLISGRRPQVSVAPLEAPVPDTWRPLPSRPRS